MIEEFVENSGSIEIVIFAESGLPGAPTLNRDCEPASDLFTDPRVAKSESETRTAVLGRSKPFLSAISIV
jgi:hypothetical protein